ncbi:hypothetical protein BGX28_009415 [Mortierella sp. GBA30]|nr:hypothetical protein BGX28_009415 [Mortierella sp. GBA30]
MQLLAARPRISQCRTGTQLSRAICTSTTNLRDLSRPSTENSPAESEHPSPGKSNVENTTDYTPKETSTNSPSAESTSVEDLVKKFKLKPSAEVGIRNRLREKQLQREKEESLKRAAEEDSRSGAEKINRLFEKLQFGGESTTEVRNRTSSATAVSSTSSSAPSKISDSWKFLFDEDDLNEKKAEHLSTASKDVETLDKIPGVSDLFPSLSEYRSPAAASPTASNASTAPNREECTDAQARADRWKDPKMKSTERDAFKALFSSLFEQKPQAPSSGGKVQSLFSNFNRSGQERSTDEVSTSIFASRTAKPALATATQPTQAATYNSISSSEDPMQVLRRQLENLSKRVEPIYLERKPKTSSFQVMENTVGPQDWMSRDPTLPQENSLFTAIRNENKVSIRMRKELEEKSGDIVKVKEFVDELLAPFIQPSDSATSAETARPSGVSLDGLLAQAILAASSTNLESSGASLFQPRSGDRSLISHSSSGQERSLHPLMGQALVEHTRRLGLPVFIRTVRKETYKALLKSRWGAWRDGLGCLEILREMQRNGAAIDTETKHLVLNMIRELGGSSSLSSDPVKSEEQLQQVGWGDEEQMAPLQEMMAIIRSATEDREQDRNMKRWARRGDSSAALDR